MSLLLCAPKRLVYFGLLSIFPTILQGQPVPILPTEYSIIGALPGDQMMPSLSMGTNGGLLVWQDNAIDKNGLGIGGRLLRGDFSPASSNFVISAQRVNDQGKARVAAFPSGTAAVVFEGGKPGLEVVFAQFITPAGRRLPTDIIVPTNRRGPKLDPAVGANAGGALVTWSSFEQDGSLWGVYAQRFLPNGRKAGREFRVNQFTNFNQKSSAVVGLANGNFLVAWISEQQRREVTVGTEFFARSGGLDASVDVYARLFSPLGVALTDEFRLNSSDQICAMPSLAAAADGSAVAVWVERDGRSRQAGWDVYGCIIGADGVRAAEPVRVNTFTNNDQLRPAAAVSGDQVLVLWSSQGQDGSREGIYGQAFDRAFVPVGSEFRLNTITASQQLQPAVTSGPAGFLAVWPSFGAGTSFDLMANPLH